MNKSLARCGLVLGLIVLILGVSAPAHAAFSYAGTYIGQFVVKYQWRAGTDKPWQNATRSFNITIKLGKFAPVTLGEEVLRVTSVRVSDPFFGTTFAVKPTIASVAVLPVPTRNVSNKAGEGIVIFFPNGSSLQTSNFKGYLHVSSDGRLLSNALVAGETTFWLGMNNAGNFYDTVLKGNVLNRRNVKSTWSLTKSAL